MTRQQRKVSTKTEEKQTSKVNAKKNTASRMKRKTTPSIDEEIENEQPLVKKQKMKSSDAFTAMPTGIVLTLGEGNFGQLGLGEDIMTRKKPALVAREIAGKKIKKVVAGGLHTVCLTEDHEVYTFGCNDEGSLGRVTTEDTMEFEPGRVGGLLLDKIVIDVTAGDSHSVALTDDGQVYVWGCFRDNHGKLGLVKEWEGSITPVKLELSKITINKISSGNDHVAMITADGQVMTLGSGEQGQLGRLSRYCMDRGGRRNTEDGCLRPKTVRVPKFKGQITKPKFSEVYCGSYFTFVLSTMGDVFAFGLNNYFQLGLPDADCKFMPVHVPALSDRKWKMISGGQHHSILLDENGDVYTIGRGEYGRLGLGEDVTQADEPTKVKELSDITHIAAGSCVSFAVDKHGKAYGWGMGTNLQLTTGQEDDEWKPVELTGKNLEERSVLLAEAGGQHTVLLACDSHLQMNGTDTT